MTFRWLRNSACDFRFVARVTAAKGWAILVNRENDMSAKWDRTAILARLRMEIDDGHAIYDALCGSGITAKMAVRGGASMVTTHSLAYFRMQGLSSMAGYLPICDANALTLELGERVMINVVRECPLIAGLLCVDPTRDMPRR
jgi:predicted TIM-barrel enzyme